MLKRALSGIREISARTSVRSVGIYTFTGFLGKSISFLLVILFTNPAYISPAENGLLGLFSNSMLFLLPFLSLGIIHSTGAEFFKLQKKEFNNLFTTGFIMAFVVMILAIATMYIFRDQLLDQFGMPSILVFIIPLITFFIFCNEQLMNMLRNRGESTGFLYVSVSRAMLDLVFSVFLVMFLLWRWEGRVYGLLATYAVIAVYAFLYFSGRGYLSGRITISQVRKEFLFAIPVITLQLSIFALSASDRFFLSAFTSDGNQTVGIYNIAATFGSVIIIACTSFLQYLFPKVYSILSAGNGSFNSVRKEFRQYVLAMTGFFLLIMIATPVAYYYLINEKYMPGLRYFYLLCTGYFLWTIAYFFFSYLIYFRMKWKIFTLSILYLVISIPVNYFFIREWGAWGAAFSNICCYLLVLLITLFFTRNWWSGNNKITAA